MLFLQVAYFIQNQKISIRRRCENDGPHFDYLQARLLQFNFKWSTQYHPALEFLVRVQKPVARLISHKTRFQHISPVMKDLHWLPINKRIEYKILVLTFKSVHNLAPAYLTELLDNRTNKGTRADNKNLLVVPKKSQFSMGEVSALQHLFFGTSCLTTSDMLQV